jgi:hypothetical protein
LGAKNPSVNADKEKKNGKIVCQMCERQGQQSCELSLCRMRNERDASNTYAIKGVV